MRRVEMMKVIKQWGKDRCYSIYDINFTEKNEWLIIDFNAVTVIYMEIVELIEDLHVINENVKLYSIDITYERGNALSVWLSL